MNDSIRATLLVWYGLILAVALSAFGGLLYWRASASTLAAVDASVAGRAGALAGALEWDEEDGWELELSRDYLAALADGSRFAVWTPEGELLLRGGPAVASPTGRRGFSTAEGWRELRLADPRGALVLVGQSLEERDRGMRELLGVIVVSGALVLVSALLGGWWLTGRALAPIARIAEVAAGISEQDLDGRVGLERTPAELRTLARTLNDAFDRLQAAFARQVRFTADASHELRTPLSVIRTQAELALKRERDPQAYRLALGSCLRAAERLSRLADRLLVLARVDSGAPGEVRETVDLQQLVRDCVEELRPVAQRRELTFSMDVSNALVRGEREALIQVVTNLLDNAVQHSRPGSSIGVDLRVATCRARLRVSDRGAGIPAEALTHVFERFYRVDAARSSERGGAGLGLAIVRAIVEAHGGSVAAQSREGEGSSFSIELPAVGSGAPG